MISTSHGIPVLVLSTQPDSTLPVRIEPGYHHVDCLVKMLPLSAGEYVVGAGLRCQIKNGYGKMRAWRVSLCSHGTYINRAWHPYHRGLFWLSLTLGTYHERYQIHFRKKHGSIQEFRLPELGINEFLDDATLIAPPIPRNSAFLRVKG